MSGDDTTAGDEPAAGASEQPPSVDSDARGLDEALPEAADAAEAIEGAEATKLAETAADAPSGWDEARAGDDSNAAQAAVDESAAGAKSATDAKPQGDYQPPAYQPPTQHYAYPVTAQQQPYPGQSPAPVPQPGAAQPGQYGYPGPNPAPIGPAQQQPFPGQAPVGAQASGYAPAPPPPGAYPPPGYARIATDSLAITSLVLSILALFTCGLTALPGIICGHISLSRIKREPERLGGRGLALAGTITGWVIVVLIVGSAAIGFTYLGVHGCYGDSPPADCS